MKLNFKTFIFFLFALGFAYSLKPIKHITDYTAYHLAGKRILAKTLDREIDLPPIITTEKKFTSGESIYQNADLNPFKYTPVISYIFIPFSILDLKVAEIFWYYFSFGFLILTFYLLYAHFKEDYFKDPKKTFFFFIILTVLGIRFFVLEVRYLQVNFITLFCLTGFLHWRKRKENLAAFLLAFSVAIKIFPIFCLLFLFIEKEYRMILKTIGAGLILGLIPLITYGNPMALIGEYLNYASFMTNGQHLFPASADYYHISFDSFIVRFFMDRPFYKDFTTNIFSLTPNQTFLIIVALKVFFLSLLIKAQKALRREAQDPKSYELYYWVMMGLYANFFSMVNPLAWKHGLVLIVFSWWPILLYWFEKQKLKLGEKILLGSSLFFLVFPMDLFGRDFKIIYLSRLGPAFLGVLSISFLLYFTTKNRLKNS